MRTIVGEVEQIEGKRGGLCYVRIRNINKVVFDVSNNFGSGERYYEFTSGNEKQNIFRTKTGNMSLITYDDRLFFLLQMAFDKKYVVEVKYVNNKIISVLVRRRKEEI